MHKDAVDVGFQATLNLHDMASGMPGMYVYIWYWSERVRTIAHRKRQVLQLEVTGSIGKHLANSAITAIVIYNNNQAFVNVFNSFVSASPTMMWGYCGSSNGSPTCFGFSSNANGCFQQ